MVKKLIFWIVLIVGATLVFMPKEALYFKAEHLLAKQDIKINEQEINERLFGLDLKGLSIFVKGIKVATVKEASLSTFLVYSQLDITDVETQQSLAKMLPKRISHLHATHTLLSPQKVDITVEGSFGVAKGAILLNSRKIHLDFVKTDDIEVLKPYLKKGEKGWYYEVEL